ncbi:single-stranded nucleic acid binding R3H domain protein [Nitrosococcus halophilus Nc 4]|uniref:Single-stranded nucleic acid binding R3H domain protein n=1 Tax=Nitrosococcus halophilus (strain Nc4) TaxID=472759 RepID=D5BVH0_NITHN|nr:R3H domain-containing nucleic acid-binding protein [Nitrosococcus halophilus]ADE13598.1 single-stranded nucleic acid binding R3H domain protein [Nitrosococcus halophilus Nc 4]
MNLQNSTDDLQQLIGILPRSLRTVLQGLPQQHLLEIIMDVGRSPQARFSGQTVNLSADPVSPADLEQVVASVGEFSADNRAGIEGTLHRISCLRNRRGKIIGLTLRVGRAVTGTIDSIRDLIERGASLLLLGRPGVGKTTRLREIARVLADEFGKRVIIIDTSNEIAGDGDIPHPAIGSARRMQVPHPERQHGVMIEAVENHMPEVIIVDEIGTGAEATAARTIAERGVQLIGTAHGNTLENLVMNPTLADLVGGVQTVTLGDDEARLRGTQKTINERKAPPTFDAVVEIVDREAVIVHPDTAGAVDKLLRGLDPGGIRRSPQGEVVFLPEEPPPQESPRQVSTINQTGWVRIHPYALSRDTVERVIRDLRLEARTVKRPDQADFILALRSRAEDARLRRILQATQLPLYVVKKNTTAQIRRLLQNVFNILHGMPRDEVDAAVGEAEAAIKRVMEEGVTVALLPRPASMRKLQHRLAARHRLTAESVGSEPQRHLIIHPT